MEMHRSDYPIVWASGASPDIEAVVAVIVAWLQGASASEVSARFNFVSAEELADIVGDEELVEAQWRSLLADDIYDAERPFLDAVYEHERARRLFPMLSHGVLRLGADIARIGGREVRIVPLRHGGHRIENEKGHVLTTLDSLAELGPHLRLGRGDGCPE
ncbi:hypothetical protein Ais01nite_00060 [Asanoa ishikariensis]|nr:hypothetical protein Ais01nite_00060 [Asanoa ishikariensis]